MVEWVRQGGLLLVCDDDSDPYRLVREWWNSDGQSIDASRVRFSSGDRLLWVRFENTSAPRELRIR